MTQCVCYNEITKREPNLKKKRRKTMNGTMKKENFEKFNELENETAPVACNFSGYSMTAVAGGILLCAGIIIYAVLTH